MSLKITGKLPSTKLLARLKKSPNYKNKGFQNLSETPMIAKDTTYWKMTRDFLKTHPHTKPQGVLPSIKTDLKTISTTKPVFIWFGHSSYFIRFNNKNFLVDPVFSGNAAPLSFMVKAFRGADIYSLDEIPEIDYLVLTHDHYDHLDYKTIRKLKGKISKVVCSLGISSHLVYWGIEEEKIIELDWWDKITLDAGLEMIAAPARHFSGRGIRRGQTLWSSFILRSDAFSFYLGGDSGYDQHFKELGERFGPFDLAVLECGQYNRMWPLIHMMPEETAQAAIDLKAKVLLPVHWGKFMLAMHEWNEPVKRVLEKAKQLNLKVTTPRIGEPVVINGSYPVTPWWQFK
jgi:L-ascorbate metabolism protein UlaG (beta-lactamase superfamily)